MNYYALAVCLALAAFFLLNVLGTLLAALLWLGLERRAQRWRASARAGLLFGLRVLPPTAALLTVSTLLLPAYLAHEPNPAPESAGFTLTALALFSASCIAFALCRAVNSLRATKRLTSDWRRRSEPVRIEGLSLPAYRLKHPTPVIAVVGTLRPRLFIAEQILSTLSPEELAVALKHEKGHLVARDTLKRAVLKICRDLLPLFTFGRALDRAWAEESERAADEYAALDGAAVALDLATALVKIARLMPAGASHFAPAGAFLLEGADSGVAGRVRRLAEMAATPAAPQSHGLLISRGGLPFSFAGFTALPAAAIAEPEILVTIHALIEYAVILLR